VEQKIIDGIKDEKIPIKELKSTKGESVVTKN
jgi:hypothetical protein